tara:strand:+ start:275 stop:595 length:321 start_codon:yes stop_codon:yes gene_type:complete
MTNNKQYTTNKIYFIVKDDPEQFINKHKQYLMNTEKVYDIRTFDYQGTHFINIIMLFQIGKMNQKDLNLFMNEFIMDNNIKSIQKAFYKFKDKYTDEYKLQYSICI